MDVYMPEKIKKATRAKDNIRGAVGSRVNDNIKSRRKIRKKSGEAKPPVLLTVIKTVIVNRQESIIDSCLVDRNFLKIVLRRYNNRRIIIVGQNKSDKVDLDQR
jgi:uncharacterized protein YqeY